MRRGRLTRAVPGKPLIGNYALSCDRWCVSLAKTESTTAGATDLTRPVQPFGELRDALHRLDELSCLSGPFDRANSRPASTVLPVTGDIAKGRQGLTRAKINPVRTVRSCP